MGRAVGTVNWEKPQRGAVTSASGLQVVALLLSVDSVGTYYKNKTEALFLSTARKPTDPCFSACVAFLPALSNHPFDRIPLRLTGMVVKTQPSIPTAAKLQVTNQLTDARTAHTQTHGPIRHEEWTIPADRRVVREASVEEARPQTKGTFMLRGLLRHVSTREAAGRPVSLFAGVLAFPQASWERTPAPHLWGICVQYCQACCVLFLLCPGIQWYLIVALFAVPKDRQREACFPEFICHWILFLAPVSELSVQFYWVTDGGILRDLCVLSTEVLPQMCVCQLSPSLQLCRWLCIFIWFTVPWKSKSS